MESQYDEIWAAVPLERDPPDWDERADFCRSLARAGDRVLDLGCGDGRMLPVLVAAGCHPVGADPSRLALERAAGLGSFELIAIPDDGPLPLEDESFDGIWMSEVIGQAQDAGALLSEAGRVLRRGGWLGLTTPDRGLARRLLVDRSDATTRRGYTSRSLAEQLARYGFEPVRLRRAAGLPGFRRLILAHARRP